jgi:hypothetical protein
MTLQQKPPLQGPGPAPLPQVDADVVRDAILAKLT